MKILKLLVVVLTVLVVATSIVLDIAMPADRNAPEIVFSAGDVIEAEVDITDEELLSYVTAYDEKDGDLTDKIVLTRKNFFIAPSVCSIVYTVCDSDNNVTTIQKALHYTNYRSPRFVFMNDYTFPSGVDYNVSKYVSANDAIDGDISNYVKLISPEFSSTVGTYPMTMKVSNNMGDSSSITINAIVVNNYNYNLRIRLTNYITYLKVNDEVDFSSYIYGFLNKTNQKYETSDIVIDSSAVDMSKPGTYDVFYYLYEGQGDQKEELTMTRLVVVVEEA